MISWVDILSRAWPAVVFTAICVALLRASRDPGVPRGDAVLIDLCLGLTATVASVLWLRVLASTAF